MVGNSVRKYLSLLIVLCLVCLLPDSSIAAAKKKTKKASAKQSDKIEQILRRYTPASNINASAIRNILKASGNDKILVITAEITDDGNNRTHWKLVSATNASEKVGLISSEVFSKLTTAVYGVGFHMPSSTMIFYDAQGNYTSTFSDPRGLAGLKRALASTYKFNKKPNSPFHEIALMPFIWH